MYNINYIIFIGCQPQLHTAPSGIIRSPGYPNNYFDNANCVYNITVQDGKAIKIEFSIFEVESSSSCQYDKLQIFEGKSSVPKATLCGSGAKTYTSRGNKVFMRFTSDGSVTKRGFYGTYQTVDRCKLLNFKIILFLYIFCIAIFVTHDCRISAKLNVLSAKKLDDVIFTQFCTVRYVRTGWGGVACNIHMITHYHKKSFCSNP